MKLHNQTERKLSWNMGGLSFGCEAWGEVDVPDHLLDFVKARGLPLKASPVPSEVKASMRASIEKKNAENSDTYKLRERADNAEAALKVAQRDLEEERAASAKLKSKAENLQAKVREMAANLDQASSDHKALDAKLREAMTKLAEYEQSARRSGSGGGNAGGGKSK